MIAPFLLHAIVAVQIVTVPPPDQTPDRLVTCPGSPRCPRHQSPATGEVPPEPESSSAPADAYSVEAAPNSRLAFLQNVGVDRVFFGPASSALDDEDRATLDAQARWLARFPNLRITVEGHADERGTREANLALGERRANAVRDYLAAHGVDAARITTISFGKERPEDPATGEAAWARNRRAVTVLSD